MLEIHHVNPFPKLCSLHLKAPFLETFHPAPSLLHWLPLCHNTSPGLLGVPSEPPVVDKIMTPKMSTS